MRKSFHSPKAKRQTDVSERIHLLGVSAKIIKVSHGTKVTTKLANKAEAPTVVKRKDTRTPSAGLC